jgi:hypothetical protein
MSVRTYQSNIKINLMIVTMEREQQMTKHLQEEHCTITPMEGDTSKDTKENGTN